MKLKALPIQLDIVKRWYEPEYTSRILSSLSSFSSSGLGFRLAGSDAEYRAAEYIKEELGKIGLDSVVIDKVDVDKWIFRDAYLEISSPIRMKIAASSYAGSPPADITARLIYGGKATIDELSTIDIDGKIVLIDRDFDLYPSISIPAYELLQHGAEAIVVSHLSQKGYSYMREDTLYASDGDYSMMLPPIIHISRRSALRLLKILNLYDVEAGLKLEVEIGRGYGHNVTALIDNASDNTIILGAHHDAHFRSVIDNASGVAMILNVAKFLSEYGERLDHNIMLISFTAEEYGKLGTPFDYLIGSYYWVERKGDSLDKTSLYINVDVLGYRNGPIGLIATPDIKSFIVDYLADISTYISSGLSILFKPYSWIDMWNFVEKGVSSIHFGGRGNLSYYKSYYHTQLDTIDLFSQRKFMETLFMILNLIYKVDQHGKPIYSISDMLTEHLKSLARLGNFPDFNLELVKRAVKSCIDIEHSTRWMKGQYKVLNSIILHNSYELGGKYPTDHVKLFWEEYLEELDRLNSIKEALKSGDYDKAVNLIQEINIFSWAIHVSRGTYKSIYEKLVKPMYWGRGFTHPYIDLYDLYRDLRSKKVDIATLDRHIADREAKLRDKLASYYAILEKVCRAALDENDG